MPQPAQRSGCGIIYVALARRVHNEKGVPP